MTSCGVTVSGDMSVRSVGNRNNARWAPTFAATTMSLLAGLGLAAPAPNAALVQPGAEVWAQRGFAPLAGKRIGLITNTSGRLADGRSTLDMLAASPSLSLTAIFTPEHALHASLEGEVDDGVHAPTGLPIYSLYSDTRRPTEAMLAGLEGLVFDIQDIGTRFYTYATTLAYCMEEAAERGIPIVVLDRPNPIGGIGVSGPVLDPARQSFVAYSPVSTRHGMTMGELAQLFNRELGIDSELTVVPISGWQRTMWYDATGLGWINPSPNIRNLTQALLYPAVGPLETTNVSVGRGTDAPFEWVGAPWMDSRAVAAQLNAAGLPGVRFIPRRLTPDSSVYAGAECGGVNLLVTDRDRFDTGLTAATLAVTLNSLHRDDWDTSNLTRLWGDGRIVQQLADDFTAAEIAASWETNLERFRALRARYLLYP